MANSVLCVFLAVPFVCLWSVIVGFPGHTHLLFVECFKLLHWHYLQSLSILAANALTRHVKLSSYNLLARPFSRNKDLSTLCLLVSSAENLCKQFGSGSGPTNVGPDLDPNCLTLMVFLKEISEKLIAKKICRRQMSTKNHTVCTKLTK